MEQPAHDVTPIGIDHYILRGGIEGHQRLRILSEVMGASTRALLAEAGVVAGAICLDLGCGGGDVAMDLARSVGPTGRVVGIDIDSAKLALAREEADRAGLSNMTFETGDVMSWASGERFDVIYARFLLSHLTHPEGLLATMRQRLKPAGVIIVEDVDFRGHFARPGCAALDKYVQLYTESVQKRGGDAHIGPRLAELLQGVGFGDVRTRQFHPVSTKDGIKLLTCVTLDNIADAVLRDGLVSQDELQTTIEELRAFACDPNTVLGGPWVFQAWARAH